MKREEKNGKERKEKREKERKDNEGGRKKIEWTWRMR